MPLRRVWLAGTACNPRYILKPLFEAAGWWNDVEKRSSILPDFFASTAHSSKIFTGFTRIVILVWCMRAPVVAQLLSSRLHVPFLEPVSIPFWCSTIVSFYISLILFEGIYLNMWSHMIIAIRSFCTSSKRKHAVVKQICCWFSNKVLQSAWTFSKDDQTFFCDTMTIIDLK